MKIDPADHRSACYRYYAEVSIGLVSSIGSLLSSFLTFDIVGQSINRSSLVALWLQVIWGIYHRLRYFPFCPTHPQSNYYPSAIWVKSKPRSFLPTSAFVIESRSACLRPNPQLHDAPDVACLLLAVPDEISISSAPFHADNSLAFSFTRWAARHRAPLHRGFGSERWQRW